MPRPAGATGSGGGATGYAVAVIEPDPAAKERLSSALGGRVSLFSSINELAARLSGQTVVMVLGPSFGPADLAGVEQLLTARRELGAVMVSADDSADLLRQALRAGVRDVLPWEPQSDELNEAVRRTGSSVQPSAPGTGAVGGVSPVEADGELSRVITVFSTKGGSGKSVVASNLAVSMAKRARANGDKPVVLVDADLQFGDVAVMLKLSPEHTIVDAVGAIDRLDWNYMQNILIEHKDSGLLVLAAPLEPAFADQIGSEEIRGVVDVLRAYTSAVVVDTPAYFNDVVLTLLDFSDDILLVAGLDIPNIKNVKIGLQTLKLLGTPIEKVQLVLNRADSKVRLDVAEVEKTLGIKAKVRIPSDVVVPQSINRGAAVVLSDPRSGVAKAIEELAEVFTPAPEGKKK
jgi:pilus assembly protein CpaE